MIQAQCLLKQKLLHDFLCFNCLEMATTCISRSNVMIETQLFFMNEVSDFPLCNHSMLIVSNHSYIYVLFLHFHFFCLVLCNLAVLRSFGRLVCSLALYLLWALTMRLCQAVSYTFCNFFYFKADNLFSLLCRDFAAV